MVDPIKLSFRPGINREITEYTNMGGYVDGNLVRFVKGFPQSVGGWSRLTSAPTAGVPRGLFPFVLLDGTQLYTTGTEEKYYTINGTELIDITPLRKTVSLNNPFTTTNGSATVVVADVAHGAGVGDYVTFAGATAVGGVTALMLNREFRVASVINDDSYRITVSAPATSGATGGGTVSAAYQIPLGSNASVTGLGWGTGPFGEGGFGEPSAGAATSRLRLWTEDKFGEDLVVCPRDEALYYYDTSLGLSVRMTALADAAGANQVPLMARQVIVSDSNRHVLALATNDPSDSVQDRLLIRWCDRENIAEWETTTTTTAGSLRLDGGSEIIGGFKLGDAIMVFTDTTLHTVKFIGSPYFFGQVKTVDDVFLIGPNAAVAHNSDLFFMGVSSFQAYNGGVVVDLTCDIEEYIFGILNFDARDKIWAGFNSTYGEVVWLLPVNGSDELNYYVLYNPKDGTWVYGDFGTTGRTGWLDVLYEQVPLATAPDGYVYLHETGDVDGAVLPPIKIDSWVQAAPLEIGNGDDFMFCSRIIPDVSFKGSSGVAPAVTITLDMVDAPGAAPRETERSSSNSSIQRLATIPVTQFTVKKDIEIRGRSVKYKLSAETIGTSWRQGTHRLYAAPDGKQ